MQLPRLSRLSSPSATYWPQVVIATYTDTERDHSLLPFTLIVLFQRHCVRIVVMCQSLFCLLRKQPDAGRGTLSSVSQSVSQADGAAEHLSNLKFTREGTTHRHDINSTG